MNFCYFRFNFHQNDGEVGPQHALVLLDGPAAAEEGHDDDEHAHDDQRSVFSIFFLCH